MAKRDTRSKALRSKHRKQGAAAEAKVRRILNKLPKDQFTVYHNIKAKYGNIDHLVIRNDGAIFLIETKSHRGKITCKSKNICLNDRPMHPNPIVQLQRNVQWLRTTIDKEAGEPFWITAVIVLPASTPLNSACKAVQIQPVGLTTLVTLKGLMHLVVRPKRGTS